MLNPPQSIKELIAYLTAHPRVRCTIADGQVDERLFLRYEGGIWWADPNGGRNKFTPIGFSIEKFGVQVSFEYLPD